jgi:hypothetical protein
VNYSPLRIQARRKILDELAARLAQDWGTSTVFLDSQTWRGYEHARKSWEQRLWQWIDAGLSPDKEKQWRTTLVAAKNEFSRDPDYSSRASEFDMEYYLQSYLVQRAYFLRGLRHRKEVDPQWFKGFGFYFYVADRLNDDEIFMELARLTRRKPSQDNGRRSLRSWLVWFWIPGCLWAITNNGTSARLIWPDAARPSGESKPYSEGRIKNAVSELNLWRPSKPLYWGFNSRRELVHL